MRVVSHTNNWGHITRHLHKTRLSWKTKFSPSHRNFEQITPRDGFQRLCDVCSWVTGWGTVFIKRWTTENVCPWVTGWDTVLVLVVSDDDILAYNRDLH